MVAGSSNRVEYEMYETFGAWLDCTTDLPSMRLRIEWPAADYSLASTDERLEMDKRIRDQSSLQFPTVVCLEAGKVHLSKSNCAFMLASRFGLLAKFITTISSSSTRATECEMGAGTCVSDTETTSGSLESDTETV